MKLSEQIMALPLPTPAHGGPDGTGSYFDSYSAAQMTDLKIDAAALAAASEGEQPAQGEQKPVAWGQNRFIHDDDGYAIGTDEPELVWSNERPDDDGWFPLYATPVSVQGEQKPVGTVVDHERDIDGYTPIIQWHCDPVPGMGTDLYAAPVVDDKLREALEEVREGDDILKSLIEGIQGHGNYSAEATVTFLEQARQCFRAALADVAGKAGAA